MREWRSVCYCLVELSHNLFDVEAWQHYRNAGYESFESYCENALGISAAKVQALIVVKDQPLPRPKKADHIRAVFVALQNCGTSHSNEAGMKIIQKWQSGHANPYAVISLALARYNFSTPEIRVLMRHVLGHAISSRTIKRLVRSSGRHIKRGRPRSTPRIQKGDVNDLVADHG